MFVLIPTSERGCIKVLAPLKVVKVIFFKNITAKYLYHAVPKPYLNVHCEMGMLLGLLTCGFWDKPVDFWINFDISEP